LVVVADRVENRITEFLPADLVVVNPPRAGLSRQVTEELLLSGSAERLAYVSCDPATLARDLARLQRGWRVQEVQPFDAFPQTAHVETVAWLNRC
jgi:23S rRNA (uracil1939-C5)-methyltransferase